MGRIWRNVSDEKPNGSRVRTDLNREFLLEHVAEGVTVSDCARMLGVSRWSIYDWLKADEAFAAEMDAARDCGYEAIVDECKSIVDDKDESPLSRRIRANIRLKLLAAWHPKRYGPKLEVEQTTRAVNYEIPSDLTAEEAARRYQDLAGR